MLNDSYVDEWEDPSDFDIVASTLAFAKENDLTLDDLMFGLEQAVTATEFETMVTALAQLKDSVGKYYTKQTKYKRTK